MSARLLLEVALRILGLWLFSLAITQLASLVATFAAYYGSTMLSNPGGMILYSTATLSLYLAGAFCLIRWAPNVASRWYPDESPGDGNRHVRAIAPSDLYHVASFSLGAFLLIDGCAKALNGFVEAFARVQASSAFGYLLSTGMVYISGGLLLVFGAERIGQTLANLWVDPNDVPRQQISVRSILIVTLAVAVVLATIRVLMVE